ncbi:head GIN domain-containing protein [Allomuricauda sp. SCSIO 65647]|uniref:head GIN domain-containing protein n=1 Tax=Allomuricauda sp. SCSIO 65647 TaxID=2908843 RepID=UPI001F34D522|nr:head GIN domain-containing protein [Muricauda sp. SCSIO 65647]UJH67253.1 DUF2807 domain-containing protein [Muricauda sp. SCSIO 65647]
MKSNVIFGLLATALLVSSCDTETIRVSDEVSIREYSLTDYSRLQVSGDFDAFVRFSDTEERIEIEANTNLHDKIVVSKDGNTLRIRLENNVNVRGNATMKAYITTRNIADYRVSGDSHVELENVLITDNVSIDVTGDSRFTGEMETNTLFVDLKGDSEVDIFGTTTRLDADLSGDSELKDYDMYVEDLVLKLTGDSEAYLSVSQTIDIDASGDSVLNYRGDAEIIRQRLSGDSKIQKRD